MASVTSLLFFRHLRGDSSSHILRFKSGRLEGSGRGLSFWYWPLNTSLAELPLDDRELSLLVHARSLDFQDVTVQAVVTWRVADPERLAERVDFSLDPHSGVWTKQPLGAIAQRLTDLAQQAAWSYLAAVPLADALVSGLDTLRERIGAALADGSLDGLGLHIASVRVSSLRPSAEVEKALQMPTREAIQQEADKATFERRAIAVERERAIAENELNNRIELARREEQLIAQAGQNELRRQSDDSSAKRIAAEGAAERARITKLAEAEGIRAVEGAKVDAERERVAIYNNTPPQVLWGLAAQQLAGHMPDIEHLNLSPDLLGPVLARLADAGARRLDKEA